MGSPAFWNDQQEAQKTVREASLLKQRIENWNAVRAELEDVEVLFELAEEEDDFQAWQEVSEALHKLKAGVDRLELASLLNGQ